MYTKLCQGIGRYVPDIVQDEAFTGIEAGPDVPLLPSDGVALNLHRHVGWSHLLLLCSD